MSFGRWGPWLEDVFMARTTLEPEHFVEGRLRKNAKELALAFENALKHLGDGDVPMRRIIEDLTTQLFSHQSATFTLERGIEIAGLEGKRKQVLLRQFSESLSAEKGRGMSPRSTTT